MFKKLKKQGAEIVFCPAQWEYEPRAYVKDHKKRETNLLKSLISARAFENKYFVLLCNPVMDSKFLISYSAICSPHKILKEIYEKEGLLVSKLDLNEIKKCHQIYD